MSVPRDTDPQALCYQIESKAKDVGAQQLVQERLIFPLREDGISHDLVWFGLEDQLVGNLSLNELRYWYLTPEEAITVFRHEMMDAIIATTERFRAKTKEHFEKEKRKR